MTKLLEINGVKKKYAKFSLGPIDLHLEQGTALALVGENGSGKTTLLRILVNIIHTDGGSVHFFGKNLATNDTEIKREIGYAGDMLESYSFLTVKELSQLISYWYPNWNNDRYQQLLSRYKIDEQLKYGKCSKGMKKKVEFIFTICHEPKILILDEPTAGVDIGSQRKMKEDLLLFLENGDRSLLLATHTVEEVKQLCDNVAVLKDGSLTALFNKDDVHDRWARLWVSHLPKRTEHISSIIQTNSNPAQIVTNNYLETEEALREEGVSITHSVRLSLEEVLELLLDGEKDS